MSLVALLVSLVLDTSMSWIRMLIALFISMILGLFVGILAATSDTAERIIIPVLDVLQTLPILAFFPFVILIVVAALPNFIGINAAVILLIITSMLWNIAFGAYEAIKALPVEFGEVGKIFHLGRFDTLREILIPASMPRVVEQSMLSWSIGLFYLVTSEIFSTGAQITKVQYGIGVELVSLATSTAATGNITNYLIGIAVFVAFVVATRFILFGFMERKFMKHLKVYRNRKRVLSYIDRHSEDLKKVVYGASEEAGRGLSYISKSFGGVFRTKPASRKSRIEKVTRRKAQIGYPLVVFFIIIAAIIVYMNPVIISMEYEVLHSLIFSLARIWIAFAAMLVVSILLGVYLVFISKRESSYMLLFQIIASIPATILLPLIALSFKDSGELVAFIIFFLSGLWYVLFSIVSNKTAIQSSVMEVKKIFGVKGESSWKYIYIRALLPGIITGSITAIAAEWNASIVAEYFTKSGISGTSVITQVQWGLGKLLDVSLGNGNLALMILGLINLTILIIIVNRLLWKRLYRNVMNVYK